MADLIHPRDRRGTTPSATGIWLLGASARIGDTDRSRILFATAFGLLRRRFRSSSCALRKSPASGAVPAERAHRHGSVLRRRLPRVRSRRRGHGTGRVGGILSVRDAAADMALVFRVYAGRSISAHESIGKIFGTPRSTLPGYPRRGSSVSGNGPKAREAPASPAACHRAHRLGIVLLRGGARRTGGIRGRSRRVSDGQAAFSEGWKR